MPEESAVASLGEPLLPALQTSFDTCSSVFQTRFLWLTRLTLIALVVAAVAGAVSISDKHDWPAVAALLAMLAAGAGRLLLFQNRPEQSWYDARAGAESVKTLAWQYAAAGGAFPIDEDEEAPRKQLIERFRRLVADGRGLRRPPEARQRDVTEWMIAVRRAPLEQRRYVYLHHRILDQIAWYAAAADRNETAARRWMLITVSIQAVGVVGAVLRVTGTLNFDLISIAAASAAAATAWLEAKDHSSIAEAYARTAHELALVRDDLPDELDEGRWATFVGDAESAISREHTSWLARRRGDVRIST